METETNQTTNVDPIAFTKERMAEIGEVWKTFALNKRSEAMSKVEDSLDKAPAAIKKLFKLSEQEAQETDPSTPEGSNGADASAPSPQA